MAKDKGKGLAIGAAIGAVAGVVTGILFAPKSGKETRQDIKNASTKVAERFSTESKKLHTELSSLVDKGEQKIKEAGSKVSVKTKDLVEQAKKSKNSLTVLAKSVKKGEADDKDLDKALKKAKEAKKALKTYLKK